MEEAPREIFHFHFNISDLQAEHHKLCMFKCDNVLDDMFLCCNFSKPCSNRAHVSCLSLRYFEVHLLKFWYCESCLASDKTGGLREKFDKELKSAQTINNFMEQHQRGEVDIMQALEEYHKAKFHDEERNSKLRMEMQKSAEHLQRIREDLKRMDVEREKLLQEKALLELEAIKNSQTSLCDASTSKEQVPFAGSRQPRDSVHFTMPPTNSTQFHSVYGSLNSSMQNCTLASKTLADLAHAYPNYEAQEALADEFSPERLAILRSSIAKPVAFTGNVSSWATFKTSFVQSSERGHYRAIEDLERMRDLIQGDAYKMYSPELVNPFSNPTEILMAMDKFYGLQSNAVRHQIDVITHLKKIENRDDRDSVLSLLAAVKQYALLCKQHSQEGELKAESSLFAIEARMYEEHVWHWRRWVIKNGLDVSVDGLAKFLEDQLKRIDERNLAFSVGSSSHVLKIALNERPSMDSRKRQRIECFNCCDKHPFWKCPDLSRATHVERLALVARLKMCQNCLAYSNHNASNCTRRTPRCPVLSCTTSRIHPILHGHPDEEIDRYIFK